MKDGGWSLFLRKLALSVNRLDWWNLEEEFTPYELALHHTAEQLDPTGCDRDDLRAAVQSILMIQSSREKKLSPDDIEAISKALTHYVPSRECKEGTEVTPEEAARRFGALM